MQFDEQWVWDYIKNGIAKAFNTREWKAQFGGKKMAFYDEYAGFEPSFPCIYIEIENGIEPYQFHDSSHQEKYTEFNFTIECYNQANEHLTKTKLGRMINVRLKEVLMDLFNPHISENSELPSPDETVYRRIISGRSTIDNKNKIFYR